MYEYVFRTSNKVIIKINSLILGTEKVKEVECHLKPFHIRRGLAVSPNGLFVALFLTPSIYQLQDRAAYKQVEVCNQSNLSALLK